jgi:Family of unknown function (DUF6704)
MSDAHADHGSTPAAWTAVTIIMVAFVVGGIGVLLSQPWLFWVGGALVLVGVVVGKVMQMMGMGAQPPTRPSEPSTTA